MRKTLTIIMTIAFLYTLPISSQAQTTSKKTMEYVSKGSVAYLKKDYEKASNFIAKQFDLFFLNSSLYVLKNLDISLSRYVSLRKFKKAISYHFSYH
jgi:hypothetical protein